MELILGAGMGFMVPVAYTTFNQYFIKRRVIMMGLTQAMKGIIITLYPILVNFLMKRFYFRWVLAVIAAVNMHAFLGMLVMHDVKYHYKVIRVPIDETKPCKRNPFFFYGFYYFDLHWLL